METHPGSIVPLYLTYNIIPQICAKVKRKARKQM
nr:MAG TPA: hypothetical protein [Caudoviricetes sp.]